ncbi:MAG TPA: hypothetical protein DEA46_03105, partial [Candidatus Moranbacteria bacterium]|nr:hypothetical protein [Candidatus Moranbacteria bacterium]
EKTILSVLAQKEAAEKVVKYEGLLGFDELEEFKEYSFYNFLYPGNPVRLSINSPEKNSTLCRVTISSDSHEYLPIGLFEKFKNGWFKKFHQISGPPLPQARAEKTNILALPNNCILSFEKDRWWHRIKGVQGSKHECYRHEALEMVTINNMKAFLTEEAWADIIKSDQPILED